jgi:hypothetical protein
MILGALKTQRQLARLGMQSFTQAQSMQQLSFQLSSRHFSEAAQQKGKPSKPAKEEGSAPT